MTPVAKGTWLAVANVLLIAFALTVELHVRDRDVLGIIVIVSIVPAVILGAVLGRIAESTAGHRPLWRFFVLAVPACGLVIVLANLFDMQHFVPHACIPTVVAASILERTTRRPQLVPHAAVE